MADASMKCPKCGGLMLEEQGYYYCPKDDILTVKRSTNEIEESNTRQGIHRTFRSTPSRNIPAQTSVQSRAKPEKSNTVRRSLVAVSLIVVLLIGLVWIYSGSNSPALPNQAALRTRTYLMYELSAYTTYAYSYEVMNSFMGFDIQSASSNCWSEDYGPFLIMEKGTIGDLGWWYVGHGPHYCGNHRFQIPDGVFDFQNCTQRACVFRMMITNLHDGDLTLNGVCDDQITKTVSTNQYGARLDLEFSCSPAVTRVSQTVTMTETAVETTVTTEYENS